jgi:hypothetical protein
VRPWVKHWQKTKTTNTSLSLFSSDLYRLQYMDCIRGHAPPYFHAFMASYSGTFPPSSRISFLFSESGTDLWITWAKECDRRDEPRTWQDLCAYICALETLPLLCDQSLASPLKEETIHGIECYGPSDVILEQSIANQTPHPWSGPVNAVRVATLTHRWLWTCESKS